MHCLHCWSAFWRGSIISAILTAALALLQMLIMGIPFAPLIALLAGIMTFIPIVGGIVAAIPIFVIPLTYGSSTLHMDPLTLAIVATVVYQIGQLILWNGVIPRIYGGALDLSVALVVIVIAIGTG